MMQQSTYDPRYLQPQLGGGGGEEEEEDEQKQDKSPNTCQLKNVRPEQRKY